MIQLRVQELPAAHADRYVGAAVTGGAGDPTARPASDRAAYMADQSREDYTPNVNPWRLPADVPGPARPAPDGVAAGAVTYVPPDARAQAAAPITSAGAPAPAIPGAAGQLPGSLPPLAERVRGEQTRAQRHLATVSVPAGGFDTLLGSDPDGTKAAIPHAPAVPRFYPDPVADALPSAGGAAATIRNTPDYGPRPMTWRVPPSPWDASYVEAGTDG